MSPFAIIGGTLLVYLVVKGRIPAYAALLQKAGTGEAAA